jgi:serine/threonine protein kinase
MSLCAFTFHLLGSQFAPEKRMTVEQALAHPYLALLHDPNDEPVCDSNFDFSFETDSMTKESLKEMLWDELENFSPPVIRKLNSIEYDS